MKPFSARRRFFGGSLIRALQAAVSLILAISIVLGLGSLAAFAYQIFVNEREQAIAAIGTSISKSASRSISLGDFIGLENSLQGARLPEFICSIRIFNEFGSQIAAKVNQDASCSDSSAAQQLLKFEIADGLDLPGAAIGESRGLVELRVDHSGLKRRFFGLIFAAIVGSAIFLAIILFLASRVIFQVIRPLTDSVDTASKLMTFDESLVEKAPEEIRPLLEKIGMLYRAKAQSESDARVARIAAQVAHDIRSPLTALLMVEHSMTGVSEDVRNILKTAVKRIQAIVNDLRHAGISGKSLSQSVSNTVVDKSGIVADGAKRGRCHVLDAVESIVAEKLAEYGGSEKAEIELEFYEGVHDKFVGLDISILNRMLSNLINNSIEAFQAGQKPRVHVGVRMDRELCAIEVRDFGCGIPSDLLPKLFMRGASFNKLDGSGLGLHSSKEIVDAIGGSISIVSEISRGTTVTICVPTVAAPSYFQTKIQCVESGEIVSVDDDKSVHLMWEKKIKEAVAGGHKLGHRYFLNPEEFKEWFRQADGSIDRKYLIDFNFNGSRQNGLSLVKELDLASRAVLVTSMADDPRLTARCLDLEIGLMPKTLASYVKVESIQPAKSKKRSI